MSLAKNLSSGFHKPALYICLALDFTLIFLTAVLGFLVLVQKIPDIPDLLNIGRDWSIAETFNYLKWGVMAGVFYQAYRSRRIMIFAWLAVIFVFILADDSLQLHEQTGENAFRLFGREESIFVVLGELAFWLSLGMVCLGILVLAWPKTPGNIRTQIWPLVFLFAGVVFCGAGVDFLHFLGPEESWFSGLMLLIEDGGEMLFISLMTAYTIGVFGPVAVRN